jgi:glutaredoxin
MYTIYMFTIFVKRGCCYCKRSLESLRKHKLKFTKVVCKDQGDLKSALKKHALAVPRTLTFPRVFKDSRLVGGSDDLETMLRQTA